MFDDEFEEGPAIRPSIQLDPLDDEEDEEMEEEIEEDDFDYPHSDEYDS